MTDQTSFPTKVLALALFFNEDQPMSSIHPTVFAIAVGKCHQFFEGLAFSMQTRYFNYDRAEFVPAYHVFPTPESFGTFVDKLILSFPDLADDLKPYIGKSGICARFTVIDASEFSDEYSLLNSK